MKVIIAWDGDHIGREVGRASLADDVEGLRRISQAIDQGNRLWESWVTMNGGSIISFGGDEGRAEILAEKLSELPKIRDQYAKAVGSTVSLGVGTKLSEADRALMACKLQGGDKIILYTPEVEDIIAKMKAEQGEKTEADKLSEEYLNKALPGVPAANEGDKAGFSGASKPSAPSIAKPTVEASEHSQGEAAQAAAEGAPAAPEATASADQFEDMFHQAASDQKAKDDGQGQPAPGSGQDQLRAQVVQVLQALKQQMPILEQIKGTAPDTYQAVMGLAQSVILMARTMNGDSPTQTGQREVQDRAASQAQIEVPLPPEEGEEESKDGKKEESKGDDTKKAEPAYKLLGDALVEVDPKSGKSLGKGPVNKDALKTEKEPSSSKDWHDCEDRGHCWGDGETGEHCLLCGTHVADAEDDLDKASLSPAGKTPPQRHHLNLPVGSHKDPGPESGREVGQIKIQHNDNGQPGKQGWVQARAGQVLSQDGHAVSSRNPGGK